MSQGRPPRSHYQSIDRPWLICLTPGPLGLAKVSPGDEPKASPKGRPTGSRRRPALTCCSTPTTRSTGIPGVPRRSPRRRPRTSRFSSRSAIRSCYWCHVMERESFMDPEIAKAINAGFVAIKVDREERPDVDQVYMTAVQVFNGSGGWPMSVFMTPDGRPVLRRDVLQARRLHRPAQGRRRSLARPAPRDREGRRQPRRRRPQGFRRSRSDLGQGPADPRAGPRAGGPPWPTSSTPSSAASASTPPVPSGPSFPSR